MINFKKMPMILFVIAALFALPLSGCGDNSGKDGTKASSSAQEPAKLKVLKIGATPAPHAEILKFIIPMLRGKGIDLQVKEFTDYVLPNMALQNKELDANFFQHLPYLEDFNKKNNTQLSAITTVHFEPLGLYPGKTKSLEALKKGDIIAVPSDTTNEARALLLLESAGLIKIKPDAGLKATATDIIHNPKKLVIKELEAAQIARSLPDVQMAVINGNYALEAKLNVAKDALKAEGKDTLAAKTFANIVVVRTGDENREEIKALKEAINSKDVRDYINQKYQGAIIPVF
ncbi:MAG: MetQ/NlpA family ABC transporter substrate-binding protein [Syntrophales bacterium]|nr:MetQ/NlpA family ABC transporter substrate-binding protein [Syntrophales bacterium]